MTRKWPPAVGGMEIYSRELATAMAQYVDVEVIALRGRANGAPPSALALAGFMLRAMAVLGAKARRHDVILFGDFVLLPLAVWAMAMAPHSRRFLSVHGLDLVYGRGKGWKSLLYRAFFTVARLCQGSVHRFIANSSATARVATAMGIRRVVPVPLGVNLGPADSPAAMGEDGRRPSRYVLFVGRIVPRKGLAWFADNVLPRLPEDVTMNIVGTVWDSDELRHALLQPRARYLGVVSDDKLHELRRGAALVVMPNRRLDDADIEGFGLAALEAAADGALLVASGIEGIVDAVVDGRTGFLLPEGDVEQWTARLCDMLSWTAERRTAFAKDSRRVIAERFSWDRVARQTLDLFGET